MSKIGSEFQVNTYKGNDQRYSSIINLSSSNFVVIWESDGQDGSNYGIYGQIFTNAGVKSGSEFQVNTYTTSYQMGASVAALSNGNFVVTWTSYTQDGSDSVVNGQIFTNAGVKSGSEFQVNYGGQMDASVATLSNSNFVVTWNRNILNNNKFGVYGQIFTNAGVKSGSEFLVNTYDAENQVSSSVMALTNGNFVVTWESGLQDGSSFGIYGQIFTNAGVKSGSEFRVNTYTTNNQVAASVASLTNGNFVVTWNSRWQDGSDYGVYGQIFTNAGVKSGNEFLVNTYITDAQASPSVASLTNGNFVVTWNGDGQDGSGLGVYAQIFTNAGVKSGNEFLVNTYITDSQWSPSVASLTNGNFVVTWSSNGQDGSGEGVYAQIFSNDTSDVNTSPQTQALTLAVIQDQATAVDFTSKVSDKEDAVSALKVKALTLPACGTLYDSTNAAVVIGTLYATDAIHYDTTGCTTSSSTFTYAAVDTQGGVSNTSTVNIKINSKSVSSGSCLVLRSLVLGSIGDIDRNNEEIELEIKSGDTQLNCGLFLFDVKKNIKDKDFNIKIPCVKGEFVDVRIIERDVCNDDMTLESIKCESTEGLSRLEIKISADATSTSYTQCVTASNQVQDCVDASVGEVIQVGGEFCHAYEWGIEECGATQVSETASEYVLEYEVSDEDCSFDWSELSEEEDCGYHQYYPGPVCDANVETDGTGLGVGHYIASFAFLWV